MKIIAFPKNSGNPYQELLYQSMRRKGDIIEYVPEFSPSATLNLFLLVPYLIFKRVVEGYEIFHLHWTYPFSLKAKILQNKIAKKILYVYFLLCLYSIKFLRYKLVWTAHNILPHEPVFPNDFYARIKLIKRSDLVIFPSTLTQKEIIKIAKPQKDVVIQIGSYIGVYPMNAGKIESRKKIGIPLGDFVYFYIGVIRPYKGIDDLLVAYKEVKNPHTHLIVGGDCLEPNLRPALIEAAKTEQILWYDGIIPDDDLQYYFAAADVVILPFKKVTTSSSILLSFSFGRTAILPNLGDFSLLPDNLVYKYDPNSPKGLVDAMIHVAENCKELDRKSRDARDYAEKISWPSIAERTRDAMRGLLVSVR